MGYIDLHVHSTASDGSYTPAKLVKYACEKGLSAFALTDHDTVDGLPEAFMAAETLPVTVISGIELACNYGNDEIHILGYNFNYRNPDLVSTLKRLRDARNDRNEKMCEMLAKHGVDISAEKLKERFDSNAISRANFATYMVEKGYVKSVPETFEKYIGRTAPCYVPRYKLTMQGISDLIKNAGGVCSLAHPVKYKMTDEMYDTLLEELKASGIRCIEAIYSRNTFDDEIRFKDMAKRHGFLITGGSDFHGSAKPDIDLGTGRGNLMISQDILKNIQ